MFASAVELSRISPCTLVPFEAPAQVGDELLVSSGVHYCGRRLRPAIGSVLLCGFDSVQRENSMCRALLLSSLAAGMALIGSPANAQAPGKVPAISKRMYVSGSARVTATGGFQVDQEIEINKMASFSDGEMTWLQYGNSGAEEPNALITFTEGEYGINVGRGKRTVIAEPEHCKGKTEVTATSVTGDYNCVGVVSYDAASGKMAQVDIKIRFSAKS